MSTDPVERAVADMAAGRAVVVVDDAERENEGDLVFAASRATADLLAFTIRHTSGVVCVPMDGWMLDRLHIPLMTPHNRERMQTAYTVSVDARDGTSTGISAADRARTIQVLANPATEPDEVVRPGHVFPLRYHPGGVLVRRGHTEAAVDLARLAGLAPAGVIAELVADDGSMLRGEPLRSFADAHGLTVIRIAELVRHRRRYERLVEQVAMTRLPTGHGTFRAYAYRDRISGVEHLALATGDVAGPDVLVRVHSECLTGDALGSLRCDCGPQLQEALRAIRAAGRGVVVYVRGHEGRGIGLVPKLAAYELQDGGADTVDANIRLGLPVDARDFGTAAQMLRDLGVSTVRLLTNNPAKCVALRSYGLSVSERVGMPTYVTPDNLRYLRTKRDRMGHDLPALDHPASNRDAR